MSTVKMPYLPMRRALYLAGLAQGKTYPNPVVGSVILQSGQIVGEGYHHRAGEPHAEIMAFRDAGERNFEQSEMSVTLEPCSHWGRTGPCAEAIVERKVSRVEIGISDSNAQVNGQGIEILKQGGVTVSMSALSGVCREINRRFFTFHQKKRPYVILKWAESEDGFMDSRGKPVAISNALTNQFMHTLRSREDGILVGKNTAVRDNPSLTTRSIFGRNPRRIVLDSRLEISPKAKIFDHTAEVFVLNEIQQKNEGHIHYILAENLYSMESVVTALHQAGIQSVLVEGGRRVLQNFLEAGLWDEIFQIKSVGVQLSEGTSAPDFSAQPEKIWHFRNDAVCHYINT